MYVSTFTLIPQFVPQFSESLSFSIYPNLGLLCFPRSWLMSNCSLGNKDLLLFFLDPSGSPTMWPTQTMCAHSPSQRQGMRPCLLGFCVLVTLKSLHFLLLVQPRPALPHPSRADVSLVLSHFQGRIFFQLLTGSTSPPARKKVSDGSQVLMAVRGVLAKTGVLWHKRWKWQIYSSVGHCSGHPSHHYGGRVPTCFPIVTFLIFTFPIGSPS